MFKNFARHFSGDLRNMNTNQFLYVTEQHNKHITPKSMSNILFNLLENQKGKKNGFEVDLYTHQIQTATRAYNDGADDETIVCCLFHDIGEDISPSNHGEISASMLRPYISKKNYFILEKHEIFQSKYYMHHFGLDSNKREYFKDNLYYEDAINFCEKWDAPSFDPNLSNLDLVFFYPIVEKILSKEPFWDYDNEIKKDLIVWN
jgi:predicted HD phosphohydrolase